MNAVEKKEFHEKINYIPYWVQNSEDLLKYTRHLAFRMYQHKKRIECLYDYIDVMAPALKKLIDDDEFNLNIFKSCDEMEEEYDWVYNGIKRSNGDMMTNENCPNLKNIIDGTCD